MLGVRRVYCWQPRNSRHNFRVLSIGIDGPSAVLAAAAEPTLLLTLAPGPDDTRSMFTPTRGASYLVVFGRDRSGGSWRGFHERMRAGPEVAPRLGLDLAWSDEDHGELREGYDAMSMSMLRSANLKEERGERGQSASNERLRAVRLRERAAARLRRRVRRVARVRRVRRRVIC